MLFGFAGGWLLVAAYAGLTFCYSGGAAVQPALNTDLFGLPHAGINYGLLALGMSAGSLLSYAVGCAAGAAACFAVVKPLCQNGTPVENKRKVG